jgi:hypothetical protein
VTQDKGQPGREDPVAGHDPGVALEGPGVMVVLVGCLVASGPRSVPPVAFRPTIARALWSTCRPRGRAAFLPVVGLPQSALMGGTAVIDEVIGGGTPVLCVSNTDEPVQPTVLVCWR